MIEKEASEGGGELVFFYPFCKTLPPPPRLVPKCFFLEVYDLSGLPKRIIGLNLLIPLFCTAFCRYLGRETERIQIVVALVWTLRGGNQRYRRFLNYSLIIVRL